MNNQVEIKKVYFDSGQLKSEIPYINNKKDGTETGYYGTGDIREEIIWVNGLKEGISKEYRGLLTYETPYVNNQKNGIEKRYNNSGELTEEIYYIDDKDIHDHSQHGNLEQVKELLKKGIAVDSLRFTDTPLMWACSSNQLEIMQFLIDNGSKINYSNEYEKPAILWALEKGHMEAVQLLIDNNAQTNIKNFKELSIFNDFIINIENNEIEEVKIALSNNILNNINGDQNNTLGRSLYFSSRAIQLVNNRIKRNIKLADAIKNSDESTVKKLIKTKNIDINYLNSADEDGIIRDMLGYATQSFEDNFQINLNIIKMIVNSGQSIDKHQLSDALLNSIRYNNLEVIELLIEKGADVNYFDGIEVTPLICALRNEEILKLLFKHGADANKNYSYNSGNTFNAFTRAIYEDIDLERIQNEVEVG